jgi:tetratricopeptide (TPR) repeat protein
VAETALFGDQYKKRIHYAALTLDGRALSSYGECSVLLRESMIAHRSSVFEQNSLLFMKRHNVKLFEVDRLPVGHRAAWADRGRLAVAKLASQITSRTKKDEFASTLMHAATNRTEALSAYEEVSREHPQDVFAKTGRAEVLKAMGKLPEALTAYEEVMRDHPQNVVAKNGRACVLVEMGRWEEALSNLPTLSEHQRDWVGLHIRGMILLRTGELPDARRVFEVGLEKCQFAVNMDYLGPGVGVVELAVGGYAAAATTLAQVREPALQRPATLLRVHALGADQQFASAAEIYQFASEPVSELEREIKTELSFRYVEQTGPRHDDPWLLEREVRCLLAA